MSAVCPECNKEFEVSFTKALAYSLNDEDKPKCDNCIFDNIYSKLDKDLGIGIHNKEEKIKSLYQITSEITQRFNELEVETKSYSSGGNHKNGK